MHPLMAPEQVARNQALAAAWIVCELRWRKTHDQAHADMRNQIESYALVLEASYEREES